MQVARAESHGGLGSLLKLKLASLSLHEWKKFRRQVDGQTTLITFAKKFKQDLFEIQNVHGVGSFNVLA